VLEAMSAGLPVVATDLPVFREYLRPGRDALLVPVGDAPALAAALAAVLDDRRLARELASAALMVGQRFSWGRAAAEHQAIYAAIGGAVPGSPGPPEPGSHARVERPAVT
jgi:glycosyltransferase involved in cell wall biosynthesis